MKIIKIIAIVALVLGVLAFLLSLLPLVQFLGAWLGLIALILSLFALKWYREQNLPEQRVKKALKYSILALIFGFLIAGGCSLHSTLFYVNPLKKELAPIKKAINLNVDKVNKMK